MTRDEAERRYRETAERIGDSEPADGVLVGPVRDPLDKLRDYARRLAEHPRWRWEPGILACDPVGGGSEFVTVETLVSNAERHAHRIPDIHHPATRGWMLHMLREAGGHRLATINAVCFERGAGSHAGPVWGVNWDPRRVWAFEPTEGEALAAALLAVWGAS